MKLLNIEGTLINLTADNNIITVDSILVTADMYTYSSTSRKITLVPKIYPTLGDILTVTMRNELTNVETDVINRFDYTDDYMNLYFDSGDFKNKEKYELDVIYNGVNIYRGKVLIISGEVDIQNYTHAVIQNKKITY